MQLETPTAMPSRWTLCSRLMSERSGGGRGGLLGAVVLSLFAAGCSSAQYATNYSWNAVEEPARLAPSISPSKLEIAANPRVTAAAPVIEQAQPAQPKPEAGPIPRVAAAPMIEQARPAPPKPAVAANPAVAESHESERGGGGYKIGKPYKVAGKWYVPQHDPNYDKTGLASWYAEGFHGGKTANGEIFNTHALSAAHPTLPLPSYAYVTNLENGRTILVRINNRGPFSGGRIIDLSRAAAHSLDFESKGLAKVRVRYAGRAPLNGDDSRERQYLASQPWNSGASRVAAGNGGQQAM